MGHRPLGEAQSTGIVRLETGRDSNARKRADRDVGLNVAHHTTAGRSNDAIDPGQREREVFRRINDDGPVDDNDLAQSEQLHPWL